MKALGRHVIVELYDCTPSLLDDVSFVQEAMQIAAQEAGATIINVTFHHFSPYGVSGVIVIQESHLAIHTWPEWGFASIDLFTCGESTDPWKCYAVLKKAFEASHGSTIEMRRGQLDLLKKNSYKPPLRRQKQIPSEIGKEIWFTERDENLALSLKHKGELLFSKQSPFQKVEVFDTFAFGKSLVLDGLVVATEKDEAAYHEMLVHPAFAFHSNPKSILIIGGGDGGTAREVLKYESVEKVVMIEQDPIVTEAAKAHFEGLTEVLENPKLNIIFSEANRFLEVFIKSKERILFDIILVDAADTTQEQILDRDFFEKLHSILDNKGVLVSQCDAPRWHQERFVEIISALKEVFYQKNTSPKVLPYLSNVSSLPTGLWAFACASKKDTLFSKPSFEEDFYEELSYYNSEMHEAAFCLPNSIKKVLHINLNFES